MYRDRIRFHICCHSGKFSRSSTGVFFYQILMKRNERTLYRIELLYWCKTISHKLGNMYQNFGIVNFFRRCSDQDLNSGIPNFPKQIEPIELLFYPLLCMPLKQLCLVSHFLLHFFVSKQTSFLLSSPRRYFNVLTPHGVKSQSPIIYLSVNSWNEQQQSCYITHSAHKCTYTQAQYNWWE